MTRKSPDADSLSSGKLSSDMLSSYTAGTARYDEMLAPAQTPRAHWQRMFEQLSATPPEAMRERVQWVQQIGRASCRERV
jgi:uncharacterized circularly permuted ATP-grasp superfamily protein